MKCETTQGQAFERLMIAVRRALDAKPRDERRLAKALDEFFQFLVSNARLNVGAGPAAEINAILVESFRSGVADGVPERLVRDLSALYVGQLEHASFEDRKPTFYLDWHRTVCTPKRPRRGTNGRPVQNSSRTEAQSPYVAIKKACTLVVDTDLIKPELKIRLINLLGVALGQFGYTVKQAEKRLKTALCAANADRYARPEPEHLLNWQVLRLNDKTPRDLDAKGVEEPDSLTWAVRVWANLDDVARLAFQFWGWLPRTDYTKAATDRFLPLGVDDSLGTAWRDGHAPNDVVRAVSKTPSDSRAEDTFVFTSAPPAAAEASKTVVTPLPTTTSS